jgi:DNA-binding beta-propeller fold protein YncE
MRLSLTAILLLLLMVPGAASASTGPITQTFALAWGSYGLAPGQFASPTGVATDALGNVYVADQSNMTVQKFDRLGNFITRWGTTGSGNGEFASPQGVAADASGNVYVADTFNHRIQKFTRAGAYVTQWGTNGGGNGQFNYPYGVATDAAGNVYVADTGNSRVQKFTSAGAYLSQWGGPGSGDGQFGSPVGLASDDAGDLYVADTYSHRIQKFSSTGAFITKWGALGSGNGQLNNPRGVTTDAVGNVYVADQSNHRIQKFGSGGAYLAQWGGFGGGNGQFSYPLGVAADAAGNIYVADQNNRRIQKFSGAGVAPGDGPAAFLFQWGSPGQFVYALGVATDAAGNVYVVDRLHHVVQKFGATGAYLTQWGGQGSGNGQLYLPSAVATDAAGNVYVADTDNHRIEKFTSTGTYLGQWGTYGGGNGQFYYPNGVATDGAGDVYVADTYNDRIQKFTAAGVYITQWGSAGTGDGQFSDHPFCLAADAAGNVYVTDGNRIQKFSSAGAYITQWGGQGSGNGQFLYAGLVATDRAGNVYVSDGLNYRIQKFTGSGAYLTQWGTHGSGNGQFNDIGGVATDASGNIYVTDYIYLDGRVQKFVAPPAVALVSDVRNDQGRRVQLRFLRSSADAPGIGVTIQGYEIYRRNDPLPQPAVVSGDEAAFGAGSSRPGLDLAGWTYLMTAPAHGESEYNVVVPTLVDATAASLEYSAFMVRAVTSSPFTSFDSGAENGFSVDNLPPPMPTPFLAAYLGGGTHLHWGVSPATDFAAFRLYRGSSADFLPGPGTLVTALPDTGYVDIGPAGSFYKLSAVDFNGNESPFALVGPHQTTDVMDLAAPVAFALEGVHPNPAFGGRLLVHFALTNSEPATLDLLDIAGRRVRERAVGPLGAGRHVVDLSGSQRLTPGLYFLRLTQGAQQRVARATLVD